MNDIKKLLGKRIKELRRLQGISQQRLAKLGQRSGGYSYCGDTFPSKALLDIAAALNIELKDLFDFEHLELNTQNMVEYIKTNIDYLPQEYLTAVYRMVRALR